MSRFFARLALSIAGLLVMVVAAGIATGYFAYALDLFLVEHMSPPLAAVLTGILILLAAALIVAATQLAWQRRRPPEGYTSRETREAIARLGGELGQRLLGFAETQKTGALLAALVAGFAVGVSPRLREFLVDILKK